MQNCLVGDAWGLERCSRTNNCSERKEGRSELGPGLDEQMSPFGLDEEEQLGLEQQQFVVEVRNRRSHCSGQHEQAVVVAAGQHAGQLVFAQLELQLELAPSYDDDELLEQLSLARKSFHFQHKLQLWARLQRFLLDQRWLLFGDWLWRHLLLNRRLFGNTWRKQESELKWELRS
jgi:hypothetical protein